jgi:hypothetical protein
LCLGALVVYMAVQSASVVSASVAKKPRNPSKSRQINATFEVTLDRGENKHIVHSQIYADRDFGR